MKVVVAGAEGGGGCSHLGHSHLERVLLRWWEELEHPQQLDLHLREQVRVLPEVNGKAWGSAADLGVVGRRSK